MKETKLNTAEKQLNTVPVSAFITPELNQRFMAYVNAKAMGNKSFALKTAIEILVSMFEEEKI